MSTHDPGAVVAPPPELEKLNELLRLGQSNGDGTVERIQQFFRENPDLWMRVSDLAQVAAVTVANIAGEGNNALVHAYLVRMSALQRELSGENPNPLVRLLSSHVALSWLISSADEVRAAECSEMSTARARYLEARSRRSSRRLESAARTYATVKRLLAPSAEQSHGQPGATRRRAADLKSPEQNNRCANDRRN
jgi:hypothetical protein